MLTDAQLIAAASSDPAAFRELYERHARRVYGFHLRRCRDADGAHDLTAETFAQAWLGRRRFRDEAEGSAAPWLYGIARNVLAASVRKSSLERSACTRLGILELLDRQAATVEPEPSWLAELVADELEQLPPSQREAIQLHVVDGSRKSAAASAPRPARPAFVPIVACRPFVNACTETRRQHREQPRPESRSHPHGAR